MAVYRRVFRTAMCTPGWRRGNCILRQTTAVLKSNKHCCCLSVRSVKTSVLPSQLSDESSAIHSTAQMTDVEHSKDEAEEELDSGKSLSRVSSNKQGMLENDAKRQLSKAENTWEIEKILEIYVDECLKRVRKERGTGKYHGRKIGNHLDRGVFGKAMQMCTKMRNFEEAQKVFDRMSEMGVKKDVVCYNIYFDALAKRNDHYSSMNVHIHGDEEEAEKQQQSVVDHSLCYSETLNLMVDNLRDMIDDGIHPNCQVFTTLFRCIRFFLADSPLMKTDKRVMIKEEDDNQNDVIARQGYTALLLKLCDLSAKYNVSMDVLCLSELIRALVKCRELSKAMPFWYQMCDQFKKTRRRRNDGNGNGNDDGAGGEGGQRFNTHSTMKPFLSASTDLMNAIALVSNDNDHDSSVLLPNFNKQTSKIELLTEMMGIIEDDCRIRPDHLMHACLLKSYHYSGQTTEMIAYLKRVIMGDEHNDNNNNDDHHQNPQHQRTQGIVSFDLKTFHWVSMAVIDRMEMINDEMMGIKDDDSNEDDNNEEESSKQRMKEELRCLANALVNEVPKMRLKLRFPEWDTTLAKSMIQALLLRQQSYKPGSKKYKKIKHKIDAIFSHAHSQKRLGNLVMIRQNLDHNLGGMIYYLDLSKCRKIEVKYYLNRFLDDYSGDNHVKLLKNDDTHHMSGLNEIHFILNDRINEHVCQMLPSLLNEEEDHESYLRLSQVIGSSKMEWELSSDQVVRIYSAKK